VKVKSEFIWMDGKLVPFEEAQVHVLAHTLHYGLGTFEGIRAYRQDDGRAGIFRLKEHIARLFDSARLMQMPIPFTPEEVEQACIDTVRANKAETCYIRPLVFYGANEMGLGARTNPVHVIVAIWPWGSYLGEEGMRIGINAITSSFTRHHPNASLQRAKVIGHYVNSILARYEAQELGYDEALMLDANGYLAEGTGENLFVVKDGRVICPPLANALDGITRRTAVAILERAGHRIHEAFFGRDLVYVADEVFVTGTAAEVTPLRSLDRRPIPAPGPLTTLVQSTYLEGVRGRVDWMRDWITPV
jgi:branched-chain amino acid aminotransferase